MNNNKDLEKLNEWESQQNEKNKEYIDFEEFNGKYKKKFDNFNRIITFGFKSVTITSIGIGIAVLIFAFITIYALFYIVTPKNVLKSLEEQYKGEKFEIIEDFGAKDSNSRGLYIVSPKNNKNIKFKMLNTTQVRSDNDYSAQRTKYYIEHCENQELLQDIQIDETTVDYKGIEFLRYSLGVELNDYFEIEEKTEKAYKLAKYLHSKDSKMFEGIGINAKNFMSLISVSADTEKSLEEEIYSVKYNYIEQLHEAIKNPALSHNANNKQELQDIGQEEIDKIWKPKYLQIVVNEKETAEKVQYNLEDKKYQIVNISRFFKQLDKIEILKTDIFSQEVKKIKYNSKTYKIEQGLNYGKNKNDIIYTEENIDDIFKKLDSKIIYDYSNKKVYITM